MVPVEDESSCVHETKKGKTFIGIGIIFGLISAICSGLNALLAKMTNVNGVEITLLRLSTQFLIILPILFHKRVTVDIAGPANLRQTLWLRGFAGSTNLIFLYLAVAALPLGDAVTITYLSLVLIPIVSKIFLKESFTVVDVVFAIVALVGVTLIARPSFLFHDAYDDDQSQKFGTIYALISAALRTVSIVTLRKLGPGTHPFLNMIYYSICGSVTTATILIIAQNLFELPCIGSVPYILCMGVIGVVGQYFLTMSTKTERAGTVAILKSSQIIFVYIMQVSAFHLF